jgi:chemotaxis protein histidine kinase CheA
MNFAMDGMVRLFSQEAYAHVEGLHELLYKLKRNPRDRRVLDEMDDAFHALEGIALQMGCHDIARLSFELKEIIKHAIEGKSSISQGTITSLEAALGGIKQFLDSYLEKKNNGG